jgi:uncharacterized coiled-coil protein SlyX
MLVVPDLKDNIKELNKIINKQNYQIEQLQKDLMVMFNRLKEINATVEEEQRQ